MAAHFFENRGHERGVLREEFLKTVRADPVRLHAMSQEGPARHRDDRRFVCPLFRELAPAIDKLMEVGLVIRPQSRKQHLIVGWHEHVDVIDLQQRRVASGHDGRGLHPLVHAAGLDRSPEPRSAIRRFTQRDFGLGHRLCLMRFPNATLAQVAARGPMAELTETE